MSEDNTAPGDRKQLIRISINELAEIFAAADAAKFKIVEATLEEYIRQRKSHYLAAAGEIVRHYQVDDKPLAEVSSIVEVPKP